MKAWALFLAVVTTAALSLGLVFPVFSALLFEPHSAFFEVVSSSAGRSLWLGALLGISSLAALFSAPLFGYWSDRLGRKKVLLRIFAIAWIGYALSVAGIWSGRLWMVLAGRLVVGVSFGGAAVICAIVADMSAAGERAGRFAWMAAGLGLGALVGPVVGGMLSEGGAYVVPFLWGMGLLFLDWVAIYTLFEDRGAPLVVGDGGEEKGVLGELGLLLCARERRSFFGSYLCFTVGWNAYLLFIPVLWMERFSFTAGQIGGMYSYGALWFLASSGLLIHPLLRRFSSPRLLHWSLIASGLCFLPLLFFSSATLYWPLFPLQFFFYALFMAASYAHASNQVGEREQGAMMGVMQAIVSLGVVIATLLAAPLVGWNVQMALVLGLVGSILAAGLYRTT